MVHRPADSRLLTNLLSQEKEYTKHLNALLDSSHSSQASFSAYAAASPPPTSHVIVAVVASFAGADDALRGYVAAVEEWREHLKGLKNLEDEVGNIMRDREILVTRLLKASKFHKPPRDSNPLLSKHNRSSTSSLSISSSPSISSTKLSSAQSELQACEAHLASKERELTVARASAVREGLNIRLTALVHCSETWNQMGREGLRALDGLVIHEGPNTHSNLSQFFSDQNDPNKPLPLLRPDIDPHRPSSDLSHSSLAPSQSASQIGHGVAAPLPTSESTLRADAYNGFNEYNNGTGDGGGTSHLESTPRPPHSRSNSHTLIHVPPAHSIDDFAMLSSSRPSSPPYAGNPHRNSSSSINHVNGNGAINTSSPPNGMVNGTEFNGSRHVLTRRITEEDILSHAITQGGAKEPEEQAEEPGSSVEELGGAETEMEVVENPRFATKSQSDSRSRSKSKERMTLLRKGTDGPIHAPAATASRDSGGTGRTGSEKPNRIRKFSLLGTHRDRDHELHRQDTSSASEAGSSYNRPSGSSRLFGSLRGIFSSHSGQHKSHKDKEGGGGASVSSFDHQVPMISTGKGGKGGKWTTRTEKNLKALKKGGSDDEKDLDNEGIERGRRGDVAALFASPSHPPSPPASPTSEHTQGQSTSTNSRRLKKARAGKARSASVPPPSVAPAEAEVREEDGVVDLGEITDPDGDVHKETEGERERGGSATPTVPTGAPTQTQTSTQPRLKAVPAPEASGSLSRSSSVVSAPTPGSKAPARAGRGRGGNGSGHRRAASTSGLPSSGSGSLTGLTTGTGAGAGKGRGSAHRNLVAPSPIYPHPLTLMNGANGSSQFSASLPSPSHSAPPAASRAETDLNWERWAGAGGLGEVIKAPPRVGRREIMDSYGGGGPNMGVASLGVGASVAGTGTGAAGSPASPASRAVVPGATVQMPTLRAPGSVFDTAAEPDTVKEGMSCSVSAPAMLGPPTLNGAGAGTRRPAKSPFRSALRNPSRTPSPLPPAPLPPAHDEERVGRGGKPQRREPEGQTEEEGADEEGDADGASISSYETGRETLFDTREERAAEPPIPPSKSLPNGNGNAHPHGVSESAHHRTASDVSTSTDQGQTIQRRKSVRVSLKPTYVAMQPSPVYDDDDDDAGEAGAGGWSGGPGKEKDRSVPDMWEDSSEEDAEYAAARRLLARASAGAESKKKKERAR